MPLLLWLLPPLALCVSVISPKLRLQLKKVSVVICPITMALLPRQLNQAAGDKGSWSRIPWGLFPFSKDGCQLVESLTVQLLLTLLEEGLELFMNLMRAWFCSYLVPTSLFSRHPVQGCWCPLVSVCERLFAFRRSTLFDFETVLPRASETKDAYC